MKALQRNGIKILITGGSGFIGTNLIEFFVSNGYSNILNVDFEKPRNPLQDEYWHNLDIREKEKLINVFISFRPTHVVHLAARTDLDGLTIEDYDSNTIGTRNILEAINKLGSVCKIVIASSMLVCKAGHISQTDDDYCPPNIYGESKVVTEQLVKDSKLYCKWTIIRLTSIWGPWFDTYKDFFKYVIRGQFFGIKNNPSKKHYGFVGNVVNYIYQILFDSRTHDLYYIGDDYAMNATDFANEIYKVQGKTKEVISFPIFIFKLMAIMGDLLKRAGISFPMSSFRLNNMTTQNTVNLQPLIQSFGQSVLTVREGIKKTIDWLVSQKEI